LAVAAESFLIKAPKQDGERHEKVFSLEFSVLRFGFGGRWEVFSFQWFSQRCGDKEVGGWGSWFILRMRFTL
jgi:hypothetical protein